MKTLLLCGYRQTSDGAPLGLETDATGRTLIERRIIELNQLGHSVICVLAGAFADEQLRRCPPLTQTELVFDNSAGSLASNVASALETIKGEACFVLPVEVPVAPPSVWTTLGERAIYDGGHREGQGTSVSLMRSDVAPFGFPLLVTRYGNFRLQSLPGFKILTDPRLNYLQVEDGGASALADETL